MSTISTMFVLYWVVGRTGGRIVQKGQGQIQERTEEGMGVRFGEQCGGRACWERFLVVVIFSLLGPSSAKNWGKS